MLEKELGTGSLGRIKIGFGTSYKGILQFSEVDWKLNCQETEQISDCQLRLYKGALAGGRSNKGG